MAKSVKAILHPLAEWCVAHDVRREVKIRRYLREHDVVKLQLGSGIHVLEDWLNIDKSVSGCKAGAVYMDVGKRFLLPDDSVNYVYSEHLFEHLTLKQARNMLKECYRVMKTGAVMRLATPNIKFLADLYMHPEKEINRQYIEWAAKNNNLPISAVHVVNHFHTAWGHQIIYDFDTLAALLREHGFEDVNQCEMSKSEYEVFDNVEGHFYTMPYDFCCLETMILEARIKDKHI